MDVICVFDGNSKPFCTEFHVRFRSPLVDETTVSVLGLNDVPSHDPDHPVFPVVDVKRLSDSATKAHLAGQPVYKSDHVQVTVNGKNVPELRAFIGEEQFLYFYDTETGLHARTPSCAVLAKFGLKPGKNTVSCIHFGSNLFKEFNIWRLHSADSLIVMDIDGTITKSDITGYIQTVYMGMFSHVHDGIVPFLNTLKERYNYTIVYLTARPLIHQRETRLLLEGIKDSTGRTMPDGPLFPSKDKLLAALYREVISKTTVKMKSGVLSEINRVFRRAGCTRITPFVLGVGNKENDAFAYNLAGLNAENILLIDKSSRIEVWKHKQLQQMHYAHGDGHSMHAHSAHGRSNNVTVPIATAPDPTTNTTGNTFTINATNTINPPHSIFTANGSTKSTKSTSSKGPKLERSVSDGVPIVKATTPGGSENFAIIRDDTANYTNTDTIGVYDDNSVPMTIDTALPNTSTHSNSSAQSYSTNGTPNYEHSQRMYSTEFASATNSSRTSSNVGNISISNSDYFGVRSGGSTHGENRSLSTTDKTLLNLSTSAGTAEHSDFQACSLPAEKRSIWGFMRKSPAREADNGHCVNNHVFQTYNDDRLMDYVHKLCGTKL